MIEILKYIGLGLIAFIALLVGYSIIFRVQKIRRKYKEKYTVLQVRVPKENESGPIVAEQIYATLHGIQHNFSFWQKLQGYSGDSVSFEIGSVKRSIKFYVAFPERLRNLVEGQIYAQYPDVEIEDCNDYSDEIKKSANAVGTELKFSDSDLYPIKRYPQFEDKLTRLAIDPMAGITASLVKFDDPEDQAWIQVVVTPLPDKWRIVLTKCVRILKKGVFGNIESFKNAYARAFATRKLWPRIVFFPLYFVFWIQGLLITAKIDTDQAGLGSSISSSDDIEELTNKSHERESDMDAAMDKVIRPLFEVTIRLVHIPKKKNAKKAQIKLREIVGAFKQFSYPHLNSFDIGEFIEGQQAIGLYRKRIIKDGMIMNNEELATVYHLPNLLVKTPTIYWVQSRKLEPPSDLPVQGEDENLTILGKSNFRGSQAIFGIKPIDRRRHIYVIGKTGMGKSTLLENMIYSDIMEGKGVGVIDPHGDLADAVLNFVPPNRTNDVMLIDPADNEYAVAFNMLENVDPALGSIVCSGLVGIFKKIYAESWGPRLEHILRNTILALLEYPGTTMLGITRILSDDAYRRKVVRKIEDPVVKSFWVDEFGKMQDRIRVEAISPIQNKVGQFLSSPTIRNIVGQPKSTVDLRFAMDKGKIVIINLSKGKIGEDNSALLGAMFITKFQLDAMSRASIPEKERRDFYLYVDEFQNFATESFATILSEARKYRLNLTMANQYIAQMPDEVRDAVFGNVGSTLSFQVGYDDAEYISQQFGEEVLPPDLVSLSKYTAYMRLLVEGMPSKTFSLVTLPPPILDIEEGRIKRVQKVSRERYSKKVTEITDRIKRWSSRDNKDEDDGKDKKPPFKKKS
jgi:Helicase HerA, central domain/TraM recognition site of TraD and TraG